MSLTARLTPHRGRLAKGVIVVLALLIGKELGAGLPDTSEALRPFEIEGEVGSPIALRTATVQVHDVRLATTLLTPDAGYRTPGLWALASVTVTPSEEPTRLLYTAIRSGERTWEGGTRLPIDCPVTPPGLPVTCDLRFEVPPEALAGAELLLGTEVDLRHDSVGVISLGITADQVAAALETDEPLESPRSQIGVSGPAPEAETNE